jgi:hypothetical protein
MISSNASLLALVVPAIQTMESSSERSQTMERSKKSLAVMTIVLFFAGTAGVLAQGQGQSRKQSQHAIHDANGDGICDDCGQLVGSGQANAQGKQAKKGKHWGPADGSGNQGSGPQDGTPATVRSPVSGPARRTAPARIRTAGRDAARGKAQVVEAAGPNPVTSDPP